MRPLSFDPQVLRKYLRRHKIATLPELKKALGTTTDVTVFRKLKPLDYLSSYTHRGRYYALRETARFDDAGLWFRDAVGFSRHGTLLATIEAFVNPSPRGCFADELADTLHAEVQDPLHDLVRAGRLRRAEVGDASCTLPPIVDRLGINSAPGKSRSRFRCSPLLRLFRYLPMNSKPPFWFSTACSTSSSVGCSPVWSP